MTMLWPSDRHFPELTVAPVDFFDGQLRLESVILVDELPEPLLSIVK